MTNINPIFTETRLPKDIDLIEEVRKRLIAAGLQKEVSVAYESNQYILDASRMRPEAQRFLLNRYWHLQMVSLGTESIEQRYCLIQTGEFKDWLKLFDQMILPLCIKIRLPRILT